MSAVLLLGLVPCGTGRLPCAEPHLHLPVGAMEALALTVEPQTGGGDPVETAEDAAARMLDWATRQNTVLSAYIARADVTPVALGAVFSNLDALRCHVERHGDVLTQAAQAVAGHCEYMLQIRADDTPPPPVAPDPADGGGFLRHRQARRDARQHRSRDRLDFVRSVAARITPLAARTASRDVAGTALMADLSLLVPRGAVPDLVATLAALSQQSDALGVGMRLIGPSPAYSFVGQTRTAGTGADV